MSSFSKEEIVVAAVFLIVFSFAFAGVLIESYKARDNQIPGGGYQGSSSGSGIMVTPSGRIGVPIESGDSGDLQMGIDTEGNLSFGVEL